MSINGNYSNLAKAMWHLKNPNAQTGTLLIELPADVGRAYNGYKRGGIIEGSEKFRKEVMSAAVWLFGIPFFNWAGNKICENLLKIPMDIDYSGTNGGISSFKEIAKKLIPNNKNAQTTIKSEGLDTITNSVEYLTTGINRHNLDVSELKKYGDKFKGADPAKLIKKIKGAKQITSITALVINCLLMGVILPKINQKITSKKLKEQNQDKKQEQTTLRNCSMEDFKKETKKNVSFTGMGEFVSGMGDWVTYGINNSNRFRLISTDVPMIIGRCATARNKYEALEIGIMDTLAIYFYNFSLGHVEKLLRMISPAPDVNPKVAEYITNLGPEKIKEAIGKLSKDDAKNTVENLLGSAAKEEIYKQATFGKYGKINKFIKKEELNGIDKTVANLLSFIDSKGLIKGEDVSKDTLKNFIKKSNIKGAAFYAAGITVSFLGLGILIPKIAYGITKMITGKDGFIGISEEDKK